jgi:hypothetical protein
MGYVLADASFMPHWFIVQSDCISRHYDSASLEHSANETFMVSVQVWHLWVMTFMYCLHSKYMSIIAARSYCLILYLLLWVSVVGHNWLPCQCFFVIRISLLSLLCLLCVSFFLRDFYLTVCSGDGSHHHYFAATSVRCCPLTPQSRILLYRFWLIHSLAFLEG